MILGLFVLWSVWGVVIGGFIGGGGGGWRE